MSDYIKREDALNASKIVYIEYLETDDDQYIEGEADFFPVVFKKDIEKIPAADVVERKHGKWIEYPECLQYDNAYSDDHIVCSECCHMWSLLDNCTETFNYCPNCGARMEES